MRELPKGWANAELGDLLNIQSGFAFKSSEYQDEGHFLIRIGNVQDGAISFAKPKYVGLNEQTKNFELSAGDILTSLTGNIGRVARIEREHLPAALNQRVAKLIPSKQLDDNGYLFWFLKSPFFRGPLAALGKGGAQQNVSPKTISDLAIPLPPLPEQLRIVRKLDTLSARTTTARTHLGGIAKLVERYRAAALYEIMVVPEASSGDWKAVTLEQVRDKSATIRYGVVQPGTIKDEGTQLIRVCDLLGGKVAWSDLRRISPKIDEAYANARVQDDDVLVSVVGTIGRVALVQGMTEPTNIARAVSRIRPNKKLVEPKWLFWRLNAADVQARFNGDAREVARKTLNIGLLKETPFRLPGLQEQRTVVRQIEMAFAKIDLLAAEAEKALKLTDRLDQRILAIAFAGELVPQDPNDEPASVLLDRIRAEQASAP